ncbi:LacI family DNA-binding transcriptional regulator [Thermoflexus sp.]|uniref:LacI family DNA-binding transcriptional regulator n=1 Tax=Thermoflexus sp. TaxID=1969742 RepID=UPI002ADD4BF5|nr:LacI family DNA-binding transcriptional regulator [Thermoflexus sp.]
MRVTIKDIARAVGVSHTTVSRALRDSEEINPETRARIRAVAESMGYRPNPVARALQGRRTQTLGVVVTRLSDPFHTEVVQGIEKVAQAHGYGLLLSLSHEDPAKERAIVEMLAAKQVDGIIVAASRLGSRYLPLLEALRIPIVLINSHQTGPYVYSVATDNVHGGYLATRYLIDLGHRAIAYIGNRRGGRSNQDRYRGYRQALREVGLSPRPEWVVKGDGRVGAGEAAMRRLLEVSPRPTAVFCYNDLTAIGALRAAVQAGIRVPEDLSIIGFDGLEEGSYVFPALTTVAQPRQQLGRLAAEMLLEILNGRPSPRRILLQGTLLERASCGPPPT